MRSNLKVIEGGGKIPRYKKNLASIKSISIKDGSLIIEFNEGADIFSALTSLHICFIDRKNKELFHVNLLGMNMQGLLPQEIMASIFLPARLFVPR